MYMYMMPGHMCTGSKGDKNRQRLTTLFCRKLNAGRMFSFNRHKERTNTNQSKADNSKLLCDWLRLAARFRRMSKELGSRGEMLFTVQVFWLGLELKQFTTHLDRRGSSLAIETFASFDSTCVLPNI